jgi:hypothetical protein
MTYHFDNNYIPRSGILQTAILLPAIFTHNVISSNYNEDNNLNVRVYGDNSPGEGFTSEIASLEDVYFTTLNHNSDIAQPEIA